MAVVEKESLFSTPMPSFLETPSRIQSADLNKLIEIAYEMISVMEYFMISKNLKPVRIGKDW